MLAATLDRSADLVKDSRQVHPVRPFDVGSAGDDRLREAARNQTGARIDVDKTLHEWQGQVERVADAAALLAEVNSLSPAAWARASLASLNASRKEMAVAQADRALETAAQSHDDAPAVVAAVRVLVACETTDSLTDRLERWSHDPFLTLHRASLLAEEGNSELAIELVRANGDPASHGFSGYVYLVCNRLHEAVASLRTAVRLNEHDVESHINLAVALWKLGATRKALRSVAIAGRISPGRLDVEQMHLDLLAEAEQWDVLARRLRALDAEGVPSTPQMMISRAKLHFAEGRRRRGRSALAEAARLALQEGETILEAEILGNIANFDYFNAEVSRQEAFRRVLQALAQAPESLVLCDIASAMMGERSEARQLAPYVERFADSSAAAVFAIRSRLAFTMGDFEACRSESREWLERFPDNPEAISFNLAVYGHLDGDWAAAARLAEKSLHRFPPSDYLANQCAYAFAQVGQIALADKTLDAAPGWNYRLEATRGLVRLAAGDLTGGLKRYREALKMLGRVKDPGDDAAMMRIYELLALYRFGHVRPENMAELNAGALPDIDLPSGWQESSSMRALHEIARRMDLPWPLMLP